MRYFRVYALVWVLARKTSALVAPGLWGKVFSVGESGTFVPLLTNAALAEIRLYSEANKHPEFKKRCWQGPKANGAGVPESPGAPPRKLTPPSIDSYPPHPTPSDPTPPRPALVKRGGGGLRVRKPLQ